jgi:hypothetical protein
MHAQRPRGGRPTPEDAAPDTFGEFQASVLFCDRCRVAQPVRERRLLYLPEGELWEYLCVACGASLGTRRTTAGRSGVVS